MEYVKPKDILFEYFNRVSKPQDEDVLGNWQVWVYGSDREAFPPHCHMRLSDGSVEFEISLLDWNVINIKHSSMPNSWDSIDKEAKSRFFEWLDRESKQKRGMSNKFFLYSFWDGANPENPLVKWIGKKDKIDTDLKAYLHPEGEIEIDELIKSIFEIILPLYQSNSHARTELHSLASQNVMAFAEEVKLPFEFTDYNVTDKIKKIISDYERMCFEMSNK